MAAFFQKMACGICGEGLPTNKKAIALAATTHDCDLPGMGFFRVRSGEIQQGGFPTRIPGNDSQHDLLVLVHLPIECEGGGCGFRADGKQISIHSSPFASPAFAPF